VSLGIFSGVLSCYGYIALDNTLVEKFGLYDTCGVLHMHGIPGLLGGLAGMITSAMAGSTLYGDDISIFFKRRACPGDCYSAGDQAGMQMGALVATLIFGVCGGAMTASIVRIDAFNPPYEVFYDAEFFELGPQEPDANLVGKKYSQEFYAAEDEKRDKRIEEEERVAAEEKKRADRITGERERKEKREAAKYGWVKAYFWHSAWKRLAFYPCISVCCPRPMDLDDETKTARQRKAERERLAAVAAAEALEEDGNRSSVGAESPGSPGSPGSPTS